MKPGVLQVITVRPGFDGITMYVMRLVRNMALENIRVDFVFIGQPPEELRRETEAAGCRVFVITGRLRHPVRYMLQLRNLVREGGYTAVHAHGNSCTLAIEMLAAKLGGAKLRAAHSHNTYCKFGLVHKLLRPVFNALYTHAWACGEEAGRWLFGKRPFRVLRVSSETARYAYDPAARRECRRELGLKDEFVIGCVANLNPQKNHRFLIDAFAGLRALRDDVKLMLVGDGPLRDELAAYVSDKGLEDDVLMLGARSDVPALLSACDMMALTSIHEGFPSVLVEWQCAGLRALVSDRVTAATDLTGLLTFMPIDDAGVWARALKDACAADDREKLSAEAIAEVCKKGYDIVVNARELEEFYIAAVK